MSWIPAYCYEAEDYVYILSTPETGMQACPNCGDFHKSLREFGDFFGLENHTAGSGAELPPSVTGLVHRAYNEYAD